MPAYISMAQFNVNTRYWQTSGPAQLPHWADTQPAQQPHCHTGHHCVKKKTTYMTHQTLSHTQLDQGLVPGKVTVRCRIGQNGADIHSGTIIVPLAMQLSACPITLGAKLTGGHHQLFSPDQSTVNASTASETGFQHRLLN